MPKNLSGQQKVTFFKESPPEWATEVYVTDEGEEVTRWTAAGAKWANEHGINASCD